MVEYITKEMTFGEIIEKYYRQVPEIEDTLFEAGMHCIGCPGSMMESLEMGAMMHGVDPELIAAKLNAIIHAKIGNAQ